MRIQLLVGLVALATMAIVNPIAADLVRLPLTQMNTVRRHLIEMDSHRPARSHLHRYNAFHGFPEPLSNYMGSFFPARINAWQQHLVALLTNVFAFWT